MLIRRHFVSNFLSWETGISCVRLFLDMCSKTKLFQQLLLQRFIFPLKNKSPMLPSKHFSQHQIGQCVPQHIFPKSIFPNNTNPISFVGESFFPNTCFPGFVSPETFSALQIKSYYVSQRFFHFPRKKSPTHSSLQQLVSGNTFFFPNTVPQTYPPNLFPDNFSPNQQHVSQTHVFPNIFFFNKYSGAGARGGVSTSTSNSTSTSTSSSVTK